MSFKTKRWGTWRQVDMDTLIPGIKAYQTPGGAGINTKGWCFPFRGKIVVTAYASDDTPIWTIYDPVTDSIDGVHEVTSGEVWAYYTVTFGWNTDMVSWGDTHLLGVPNSVGYYAGRTRFYGWDAGLNFHDPPFYCGARDWGYMSEAGLGWDGSEPCVLSYQHKSGTPITLNALVKHTLAGAFVDYNGTVYIDTTWGSPNYGMRKFGNYYGWKHDDGSCIYAGSPPVDADTPYLTLGSFGLNWTTGDVGGNGFTMNPAGGAPIMWNTVDGESFWTTTDAPLVETARPYDTTWEYRLLRDGGYTLSDGDLDGVESFNPGGPKKTPITKCANGWYIGVDAVTGPTAFTVYALDPRQPSPGSKSSRRAFSAAAAFMGEYAICDDLYLDHILPFPDERAPSGTARPPQDRQDGKILGGKELFIRRGNGILYSRDIKVQMAGYSFGGDWWFPGENPDHSYDGFWELFGGATTIIGRYPDNDWGWLSPVGSDVMYGIGVPEENLEATGTTPTHVVRNNQIIEGTKSWVQPTLVGVGNKFRILRGTLYDQRMTYNEYATGLGSMPQFKARGGLNVNGTWTTLVNFNDIDPPELGQDNWCVVGLCTIPACRSLPQGGWLVSAALFFAPWGEGGWEWDPGARDLTFRDTGFYGVPAVPGYIGPLQTEEWHPKLLTGYDEWTMNRSDYGSTALIVFDYDGEFVECLNDFTMYPCSGSEIAVLPGGVPRLVYRVKGGGTYSDCAEGWGGYCNNSGEADMQAPLFAVYELENNGRLVPGAGRFIGFVNMLTLGEYETKDAGWRWDACEAANDSMYPKSIWSPYARVQVREAVGGSGVTLLSPRGMSTRSGVNGRGYRS